jgi:hypothetical protein
VRDAQFYAAKRVGFNQIDEFPGDQASWQFCGHAPNHTRRGNTVKQSPGGTRQPYIHMRNSQFNGSIGSLLGKIDVIYANDFSAAGIDNLLVKQILANGKPAFIGAVMLQLFLFDVQL